MIRIVCMESGKSSRRWYCLNGARKERLAGYIKRLQQAGHHVQVADVLARAVKEGYRI